MYVIFITANTLNVFGGPPRVEVIQTAETSLGTLSFDDIKRWQFVLWPDYSRLIRFGDDDQGTTVEWNGVKRRYHAVTRTAFRFSADCKHVAFAAQPREGGDWCVIVDGEPRQSHPAIIPESVCLSADGQHLAYIVLREKKARLIVDAREDAEAFDQMVLAPRFSPDAQRVGWVARRADKQIALIRGKPADRVVELGRAEQVALSDDLTHVGWIGARPGETNTGVCVDGNWLPQRVLFIAPNILVFSPDGQKLAWIGLSSARMTLFVNGEPEKRYSILIPCKPLFSPDSTRIAVIQSQGTAVEALFVNGEIVFSAQSLTPPTIAFSPDSRHVACLGFVRSEEGRSHKSLDKLIIDSTAIEVLPPPRYHPIRFTQANSLSYVGVKESPQGVQILRVDVQFKPLE